MCFPCSPVRSAASAGATDAAVAATAKYRSTPELRTARPVFALELDLANVAFYRRFEAFLQAEFQDENLLFVEAAREILNHAQFGDAVERPRETIYSVCDRYVRSDAPLQVNVADYVASALVKQLDAADGAPIDDMEPLNETYLAAMTLLALDAYPRFRRAIFDGKSEAEEQDALSMLPSPQANGAAAGAAATEPRRSSAFTTLQQLLEADQGEEAVEHREERYETKVEKQLESAKKRRKHKKRRRHATWTHKRIKFAEDDSNSQSYDYDGSGSARGKSTEETAVKRARKTASPAKDSKSASETDERNGKAKSGGRAKSAKSPKSPKSRAHKADADAGKAHKADAKAEPHKKKKHASAH